METLEQRLYRLDVPMPPAVIRSAMRRASVPESPGSAWHARSYRRLAVRASMAAAILGAIVAGNGAFAYFVPNYGRALASAPLIGTVSGPVLSYLGLNRSTVSAVDDVAVSSGHRLHVVGAYADPVRTVALVEVDDQPLQVPSKSSRTYELIGYLTDQFGHTYSGAYSAGLGAQFEPLRSPATRTGAQLTLHVTQLVPQFAGGTTVSGDWQLHFTVIQESGTAVALPAPISRDGTTYVFTSARVSGHHLELRWLVSGTANQQIHSLIDGHSATNPAPDGLINQERLLQEASFWPVVRAADGSRVSPRDFGTSFAKGKPAEGVLNVVFPAPGTYTVAFGRDLPTESRSITIP